MLDKEKYITEIDKIYLMKMCTKCNKLTNHYPKRKGAFSYIVCLLCGKEG